MLHLTWTPGGHAVPADPGYATIADTLTLPGGALLQSLPRGVAVPKLAGAALHGTIGGWLAHRAPGRPVVVMVHGWQYDPRDADPAAGHDPFGVIYAYPAPGDANAACLSFLPIVGECDDNGGNRADTALAFAWVSNATIAEYIKAAWDGNYRYACLDLALLAARSLAVVLTDLADQGARVHILAHSLGTRTTSQAIGIARAAGMALSVDRIVMLDGAEFCRDALRNLKGGDFDVVNIANMSDDVLRFGGEFACQPPRSFDAGDALVIGRTGLGEDPRMLDIQLDSAATCAWYGAGNAPTGTHYRLNAAPENQAHALGHLGHWTCYTNPGNRALVTDLLYAPGMTASGLRDAGAPGAIDNIFWNTVGTEPPPAPTPDDAASRRALPTKMAANSIASGISTG